MPGSSGIGSSGWEVEVKGMLAFLAWKGFEKVGPGVFDSWLEARFIVGAIEALL